MKNSINFSILFLFFVLKLNNIYAQIDNRDLLGSWTVLSVNNKIANDWSIPIVGISRHYELFNNYEFLFIRSGLTYKAKNNLFLTIGSAFLDSEPYANSNKTNYSTQFWIYEEASFSKKLKNATLFNRVRLETRWINRTSNKKINNRLRYRLQYAQPIYRDLYIKIFNEIFLNIETHDFNQNRFFYGLGYALTKKFKIELGYLKNHFKNDHYNRFRIAIIITNNFI